MTICFLTREFDNREGSGGISTYFRHLSSKLPKKNKIIIIARGDEKKSFTEGNITVKYLSFNGIHRKMVKFIYFVLIRKLIKNKLLTDLIEYFIILKQYFKTINVDDIDVFEVADSFGLGYVLFSLNLKYIVKLHTPNFFVFRMNNWNITLTIKLIAYLERVAIQKASLITSPSMAMVKMLKKEKWISKDKSVYILPNPYTPPQRISSFVDEKIILFNGNLQPRKGIEVLVKAFSEFQKSNPEYKLILCGKDDLVYDGSRWISYISYLSDKYDMSNIKFLGFQKTEYLYSISLRAQMIIVPSLEFENYPYVILEAMAVGLPVIASRCGGIPEIITHLKNGLLFDKGDHKSLSNMMEIMAESESLRNEISKSAISFVEEIHNSQKLIDKYINVYSKISNKIGN